MTQKQELEDLRNKLRELLSTTHEILDGNIEITKSSAMNRLLLNLDEALNKTNLLIIMAEAKENE